MKARRTPQWMRVASVWEMVVVGLANWHGLQDEPRKAAFEGIQPGSGVWEK
jgi:hypothetical protein